MGLSEKVDLGRSRLDHLRSVVEAHCIPTLTAINAAIYNCWELALASLHRGHVIILPFFDTHYAGAVVANLDRSRLST